MKDLPDEMIMHIFGYMSPDYDLLSIMSLFFKDINKLLWIWNCIFGLKNEILGNVDKSYWPAFIKMFKDQTMWDNDSMIASTQKADNKNYLSRDLLPNNRIVCYCFGIDRPSGFRLGIGISDKKRKTYPRRFIGYDLDKNEYSITSCDRIDNQKNMIAKNYGTGDTVTLFIDIASRRLYYMINYGDVIIQKMDNCTHEEFYLGTTVFKGAVEILKMDSVDIGKLYNIYVKDIVPLTSQ